jgi:hypothetical protein
LFSLVSLPRPLNGEVFARFFDLAGVGIGYSDFPGFLSAPLMKLAGDATKTNPRLDNFSAWDVDVRVFPFRGSFFVGSSFGKQTVEAAITKASGTTSETGTVKLSSTYATPRFGFLSTYGSGFTLGFDVGAQLRLGGTRQVNAPPAVLSDANKIADYGTNYPLPSLNFRLGWMF